MALMAQPGTVRAGPYTPEEVAWYETIVQRYARHVYNIAYRMVGNEADARDLSQEAFLRVYRVLRRIEPGVPLESWLHRIVTNLYIDLLRKRPRVRVESLDVPLPTPRGEVPREFPDVTSSPEAVLEKERLDRAIQGALGALSEDLRLVEERGLRWIESPESESAARRGFCAECGSSLFWDAPGRATLSIAAGTLDPPTGLRLMGHVYVGQAGDYYDLPDDDLPRHARLSSDPAQ